MQADYSVEFRHPFILGEDELRRLCDLLGKRIGNVEFRATCADDVTRRFNTLSQLVQFENPRSKRIKRLQITARSEDSSKRAEITYGGSWRPGIDVQLSGRDDVVSRLRIEILDMLAGMRPWYSFMHRVDFFLLAPLILTILAVAVCVAIGFQWVSLENSRPPSPVAPVLVARGALFVLVAIGTICGGAAALIGFRNALFPSAAFLIGQGKGRFARLERFQWGVVIAFVVSFIGGILVALWQSLGG